MARVAARRPRSASRSAPIPAGGAEIPTFLSYAMEKKLSKHPEEFGHGAIEGVAGPEAANNASSAGVLVPLLTLGIPTSATAAILLAAFQNYGLQPGPLLFQTQAALVWGLIASMYVGNVLLLILNLPLIGLWVRVLKIPRPLLYAGILVFATLGAYSLHQSVVDLVTLYVFGLLGFLMRRFGFPVAPAVIGLILGPLAETAVPPRAVDQPGRSYGVRDAPDLGHAAGTRRGADLRALDLQGRARASRTLAADVGHGLAEAGVQHLDVARVDEQQRAASFHCCACSSLETSIEQVLPCFLRGGEDQIALFVEHARLVRRAEHAEVLRQVGRAERERVDAVHRGDLVEVVEGRRGLEHHGHEHLPVGEGAALGRGAGGLEVGRRPEPAVAAQPPRRVARRGDDLARVFGVLDLRAMQVPDAGVEQPRDPFAVGLGRPHGDRESRSRARRSAMSAIVSIDGDECSMSTRAKSRPAAFSSGRIAGLRTMLTQVPICSSPRSTPARIGFGRIVSILALCPRPVDSQPAPSTGARRSGVASAIRPPLGATATISDPEECMTITEWVRFRRTARLARGALRRVRCCRSGRPETPTPNPHGRTGRFASSCRSLPAARPTS